MNAAPPTTPASHPNSQSMRERAARSSRGASSRSWFWRLLFAQRLPHRCIEHLQEQCPGYRRAHSIYWTARRAPHNRWPGYVPNERAGNPTIIRVIYLKILRLAADKQNK
jgi:hypothetical protein